MEQTDSCQREGGGWVKEGEGISQRHACITHRHRQLCGDGQREGGYGMDGGMQRGREKRGWGHV